MRIKKTLLSLTIKTFILIPFTKVTCLYAMGFDPNLKPWPGAGMDPKSTYFKQACIAQDPATLIYTGASTTTAHFYSNFDSASVKHTSEIDGDGQVGISGLAEGDAHISLSQLLSSNSTSLTIYYQYDLNGLTALIDNPSITEIGRGALSESPEKINAICGGGFLKAIHLGAKIYIVLKAQFTNAEAKRELIETISISGLWGAVSASVSHTEFSDELKKNSFIVTPQ